MRDMHADVDSTNSFPRRGAASDDPRRKCTETDAERRAQAPRGSSELPPAPSLSAQAFDWLLAAELADLEKLQHRGMNRLRANAGRQGPLQGSNDWQDQLLAEIENLAGELKRKVASYALFCEVQSSDESPVRPGVSAVELMQQTLEDIAATALGIKMTSQEAFLRASTAEVIRVRQAEYQDSILGPDHQK